MSTTELKPQASKIASLASYAPMYGDELLQSILPFWLDHSKDEANGGYFTCLDRTGEVYDTDKFIWLQGRGVWCFSHMFNHVSPKADWLEMALHGAAFLKNTAGMRRGPDTSPSLPKASPSFSLTTSLATALPPWPLPPSTKPCPPTATSR